MRLRRRLRGRGASRRGGGGAGPRAWRRRPERTADGDERRARDRGWASRAASALKLELKDERRASIDEIDASSQNLNLLVDAQMEDVADAIDAAAEGDSETASN